MVNQNKAVILPQVPQPPRDGTWTAEYGRELTRWLLNFERIFTNPFYLRGNGLFFPDGALATSGYGLRVGEVFSNAGVLTVVRPDDIWAGGFAVTGAVGTITVTVT